MTEPHRTASGVVTELPLMLTDVVTDAGINGHSLIASCTARAVNCCKSRKAWHSSEMPSVPA